MQLEGDRACKRTVWSWCVYDWANSAFATTIMAVMFPPFYRSLVLAAGHAPSAATVAHLARVAPD